MGFQQGLSGLSASSQQLNVIGNNVANANTVGFKGSTAEFADIYAASLIGSGAPQIGIGTTLASVAQEFTQGNIQTTSNSLDLAINGSGFFRLDNNGTITYTRNGQFQLDQNGYIVNSTGQRLMGNSATSLNGSTPVDLQINTSDLQPVTTTSVTGQMNLNSNSPIIDQTTTPFNASDSTSYTNSTAVTVYDNLGNSHTMQNYFVKTAANTWNVYTTVDGTSVTPTPTPQIVFNSSGAYDKTNSTVGSISYTPTTGASAMSMTLDYSSSTQYGSTFSVNQLSQNGYTSGKLSKFSIGSDGMIVGSYSNGQTQNLGRVVMANFVNPNGLQSIGGNQWVPTAQSGTELVGTPGTSTMGKIQSSALEESNVDLTSELVNMITAQRSYQANAQTIKAEDQIMQTLVNL